MEDNLLILATLEINTTKSLNLTTFEFNIQNASNKHELPKRTVFGLVMRLQLFLQLKTPFANYQNKKLGCLTKKSLTVTLIQKDARVELFQISCIMERRMGLLKKVAINFLGLVPKTTSK